MSYGLSWRGAKAQQCHQAHHKKCPGSQGAGCSAVLTKALFSMVLGTPQEDIIPFTTEPHTSGRSQARAAWLTSGRWEPVRGARARPSGLGGQPSRSMRGAGVRVEVGSVRVAGMRGRARGLLLVWVVLVVIIHHFCPQDRPCRSQECRHVAPVGTSTVEPAGRTYPARRLTPFKCNDPMQRYRCHYPALPQLRCCARPPAVNDRGPFGAGWG